MLFLLLNFTSLHSFMLSAIRFSIRYWIFYQVYVCQSFSRFFFSSWHFYVIFFCLVYVLECMHTYLEYTTHPTLYCKDTLSLFFLYVIVLYQTPFFCIFSRIIELFLLLFRSEALVIKICIFFNFFCACSTLNIRTHVLYSIYIFFSMIQAILLFSLYFFFFLAHPFLEILLFYQVYRLGDVSLNVHMYITQIYTCTYICILCYANSIEVKAVNNFCSITFHKCSNWELFKNKCFPSMLIFMNNDIKI